MSFWRRALQLTVLVGMVACAHVRTPPATGEFRGVWVATVRNIDWPSRPGLSSAEQQRELIEMFDRMAALGLNAIIFQIRPSADALYPSSLEPWSEYLTGEMGTPPQPPYDPLLFAIEAAHQRGMELHAWLNPYRARRLSETAPAAATHISQTNPELVRTYGSFLWMDPGEPAVRQRTVDVVRDIVRRYDVDGIHFDDYFYPYPENNADFPDDDTWRRYGAGLDRDDWRRKNVDDLIEQVARAIKEEKPHVKFGLSPFGIWRPRHPRSVRGLDAYDALYADSRKWFRLGWVDYFAPQLYWSSSMPQQKFGDLLQWWSQQNRHGRHLWPGLAAYRVDRYGAEEIVSQIRQTRRSRGSNGWILFSAKVLMQNRGGLADRIAELNKPVSPVPPSPWMTSEP